MPRYVSSEEAVNILAKSTRVLVIGCSGGGKKKHLPLKSPLASASNFNRLTEMSDGFLVGLSVIEPSSGK